MAIIQAPLIYYYTSGIAAIFVIIPYVFVGLGLTIWLLIHVMKDYNPTKTKFHKNGLILTVVIGSLSIFFGEYVMEKLDWTLRRNSREEIIELVKAGKLKPNVTHNNFVCTLPDWYFPPISNGGNEITIDKTEKNKFTIGFYIDRGFMDHYSAFVYTNDPEKIKEFEERTYSVKLDENWYKLSY